ncbi:uncharacterized protein PGTG_22079 [Puccinia graminis f. sp. tritici CRL 75-36-700-3]|uniref:Uncharacterized protein n=1 Tax=Puccinia graminis f. sp. tritici (strain CRL 75-36-700-3 / race SCCL) TaxID=418459 RepID=H6QTF4_PUCGT|nr:uncharacterized protein PGTG_22079 [Puccinia graminis f. sp. tritici CRL 75-36-700-3]EHS64169.1 hypothetical protein PGTG_22079 [Puccinia graminis f. sp. tritici CRL 75-36-700-3]
MEYDTPLKKTVTLRLYCSIDQEYDEGSTRGTYYQRSFPVHILAPEAGLTSAPTPLPSPPVSFSFLTLSNPSLKRSFVPKCLVSYTFVVLKTLPPPLLFL